MEFLGDAVLDLAVSDILFHMYPGIREGELTKIRAELVKEATLAKMARGIRLSDFLMLGKGEDAGTWEKVTEGSKMSPGRRNCILFLDR